MQYFYSRVDIQPGFLLQNIVALQQHPVRLDIQSGFLFLLNWWTLVRAFYSISATSVQNRLFDFYRAGLQFRLCLPVMYLCVLKLQRQQYTSIKTDNCVSIWLNIYNRIKIMLCHQFIHEKHLFSCLSLCKKAYLTDYIFDVFFPCFRSTLSLTVTHAFS